MSGITRRNALLGAGAAALAIGFGGIAIRDESDLIRDTLRRLVGPFRIGDADMAAFTRDFSVVGPLPRGMMAGAVGAVQTAGLLPVAIRAGGGAGDKIEEFQRGVLTAFVMGTDYFDLDAPEQDELHYLGPFNTRACASPFARFD